MQNLEQKKKLSARNMNNMQDLQEEKKARVGHVNAIHKPGTREEAKCQASEHHAKPETNLSTRNVNTMKNL
jgi:hypothetical protein